jgi:vitamin B12/bleomycin/antimicrobial peptide transport system ATP-binding/permease protein
MYKQVFKLLLPALIKMKLLTALVLAGTLSLIGLDVCFSYWRKFWYNALQVYDSKAVMFGLGVFCGLAALYVLVSGFASYFQRFLEFGIREHLFERFSLTWKQVDVKNPEQRLSEDSIQFGQLALSLMQSLLVAVIKLPVYIYILWSVASWWVALILLGYAALGTVLSKIVAKKLVELEYTQQAREAVFRKAITYAIDQSQALPNLGEIKINWLQLAKQNKYLSFFVSGFNQVGAILPYIMLLPLYLTKKILLGSLFQVAGAAGEVLDSLSVLVNSRRMIVDLAMTTRRLTEMEVGDGKTR